MVSSDLDLSFSADHYNHKSITIWVEPNVVGTRHQCTQITSPSFSLTAAAEVACNVTTWRLMLDLVAGVKKMTAKAAKTVKYGASVDGISTAEPDQYSKRFLAFMDEAIE